MNETMTENIDFWVKNNLNVLFRGKHGTGKTARVISAFNRNNLKWKYFSASTLDPWVDFVGVPKEVTDAQGNTYLDLIRPKEFAADEVEAIMIDEYNRGAKKVKNAVMELLQFKSINGKKFKNLRIVWAAINPDDDDVNAYDVDKMDPAQLDRFHIHVDVPYQPDLDYFCSKFGSETGEAVCEWWNKLDDKVKNALSPRRLDYALEIHNMGGSLKQVVPDSVNLTELLRHINCGSYISKLKKLRGHTAEMTAFVNDENNFKNIAPLFQRNPEYVPEILPLLEKEKTATLLSKDEAIIDKIFSQIDKVPILREIVQSIKDAGVNKSLINKFDGNQGLADQGFDNFSDFFFNSSAEKGDLDDLWTDCYDLEQKMLKVNDHTSRITFCDKLAQKLPYDIPKEKLYDLYSALTYSICQNGSGSNPERVAKIYNYIVSQMKKKDLKIDGFKETNEKIMTILPGIVDIKMSGKLFGKAERNIGKELERIGKLEKNFLGGTGLMITGTSFNISNIAYSGLMTYASGSTLASTYRYYTTNQPTLTYTTTNYGTTISSTP